MQSGGEGPGGWITGYLSGNQQSHQYHLLASTIPTLFTNHGLQNVYLPVDSTGVVFKAIVQCQEELMKAGAKVEFWSHNRIRTTPEDNPLYLATLQVDKQIKLSSKENIGSFEHIERYCHGNFPFVCLTRQHTYNEERLEDNWEQEVARVGPGIQPEDFSRIQISRATTKRKRRR